METGSHLVDQVLFVLGARHAALREAEQRRHLGLELASSLVADVTTGSGETVQCSIELSMLDDLCNGIFIEFPNYILKVGLFFEDSLSLVTADGETLVELIASDGSDNATAGFAAEWSDFFEQVRTGKPSPIDASTVRHTTQLIQAAYKASAAAAGSGAAL